MKKVIMFFLVMSAFVLALSSCGSGSGGDAPETTTTTTTTAPAQGKEHTSAYICPMHCKGSGSDAAGKCPACGMDYVANESHKSDGHDHDGHGHGDHDGHNH